MLVSTDQRTGPSSYGVLCPSGGSLLGSAFPSAFATESGTFHIHGLYLVLHHRAVDRNLNEFDGSGVPFVHKKCVGVFGLPTRTLEQQCCVETLSCGSSTTSSDIPAGVPMTFPGPTKSIPFSLLRNSYRYLAYGTPVLG